MCHSYETAGYILEFLVHHLIKLYDIAYIKGLQHQLSEEFDFWERWDTLSLCQNLFLVFSKLCIRYLILQSVFMYSILFTVDFSELRCFDILLDPSDITYD